MEMFTLVLGSCFGLVAAPAYCLIVAKVVRPKRPVAAFAFWASWVAIALLLASIGLFWGRGRIRVYEVAPGLLGVYGLLSFGAAPALGCMCLLGRRQLWWPITAVLCWFIEITAVLLYVSVCETLFGVDGIGGPFPPP